MIRTRLLALTALVSVLGLAGCGSPAAPGPAPTNSSDPQTVPAQAPSASPSAGDGTEADLSGLTIAVDPGHNGANGSHPEEISSPVPDGRGGTKACNTTGTSTASGYSEAAFNWEVAETLVDLLEGAGAEVVLSRTDNDGVGPCVDERGTFADDADALVSIHANGSESTEVSGYHLIVADPGASPELEEASTELAEQMGQALSEDFTPNEAYGDPAISRRDDLAGLNNASVPAVIVECGEMRNPDEARLMESESGREDYARALFAGIVAWS